MNNAGRICVGAIAGSYGVRGELRVKSFTAEPKNIADYAPLWSEDGEQQFELRVTGTVKNGLTARITGVATKEAADQLKGLRLFADRDCLPHLPDDEFYHSDLIGLTVFDSGGTELGRVKAVLNHGASDILEIHVKGSPQTVLLPFTKDAVPTVDLTTKRIVADPPEGVF